MVTDAAGVQTSGHDYYAFGSDIDPNTSSASRKRYAGYERDQLTNVDYVMARYKSGSDVQFLSADPVDAISPSEPLSWNKYRYARNSPVMFFDPLGLAPQHQFEEEPSTEESVLEESISVTAFPTDLIVTLLVPREHVDRILCNMPGFDCGGRVSGFLFGAEPDTDENPNDPNCEEGKDTAQEAVQGAIEARNRFETTGENPWAPPGDGTYLCNHFACDMFQSVGALGYPASAYPAANGGPATTAEFRNAGGRIGSFARVGGGVGTARGGDLLVMAPRPVDTSGLGHMGIIVSQSSGYNWVISARSDRSIQRNAIQEFRNLGFREFHVFRYCP